MNNKIDAKCFFNVWQKSCKEYLKELVENWNKYTDYTNTIKTKIVKKIAEELSLSYYNEYYSLDTVFYKDEDNIVKKNIVPNIKQNTTWLSRIRIAFEHENDISSTYQEICHLLITNCELRVLVTYPGNEKDIRLNYFKEILKDSNYEFPIHFLIIFGFKSDDNNIQWLGYEWKNNDWDKLDVSQ